MKKTIITILLTVSCLVAGYAGPVSSARARKVAESFFVKNSRTKATGPVDVRLAFSLPDTGTRDDLLYVFDNASSGGYVIISGEEGVAPVLGFSTSGSFPSGNMPESMRSMLDYYGDVLRLAREKRWQTKASDGEINLDGAVRLETVRWGQADPYNRYCPVFDGERCLTGCVPTAIGIIMAYHAWPERGIGELPSYSISIRGGSYTVEGYSLGHKYDWPSMLSGQADDQIARLLYDVGVMVQVDFGVSGSGARGGAISRLSQYFGYDKDLRIHTRERFSDLQWEQLVRDDIDAGRPVYYTGNQVGSSGHAMVIDGYSGRYFSINFGWGDADQWFMLTPAEGHEGDLVSYYRQQMIACNIKPDAGGEPDWFSTVYVEGNLGLPYDFAVGKEFTLRQTFAPNALQMQCEYALFDRAGNLKELISSPFNIEVSEVGSRQGKQIRCAIKNQPNAGDWIAATTEVDGKRRILQHNRFAEFRFVGNSVKDGVRVGFVTENNASEGFLSSVIRDGYNEYSIRSLKDYLYFCCYQDYVWELVKVEGGSEQMLWASDPSSHIYSHSYSQFFMTDSIGYRCQSLASEDICYHLIHLEKGNYVLRIKNPLTGESVTLNLTV